MTTLFSFFVLNHEILQKYCKRVISGTLGMFDYAHHNW